VGHLVASTGSLTVPCSNRASHSHYGFAFHSREAGTTHALLTSHAPVEPETDFTDSPHQRPLRQSLIDLCYSAVRQRRLGLHRFDDPPLSPNDDAQHPNSQRGYTVLLPSRRPEPGAPVLMLRSRGGGSHVIQATCATLRSNAGWPLRDARFLQRPGYIPPELYRLWSSANVFCTSTDPHR
jgi:hypothetical protein